METEEQKLRELEKSTANDQGLLSVGLFTAASWTYIVSKDSRWAWIGLALIIAYAIYRIIMILI